MRDFLNIGSCPLDEDCVQGGCENYHALSRAECRRFIDRIREVHGQEPEGALLAIKAFPHEFGTYHEVVCYYDDENTASMAYAFTCESETPAKWKD